MKDREFKKLVELVGDVHKEQVRKSKELNDLQEELKDIWFSATDDQMNAEAKERLRQAKRDLLSLTKVVEVQEMIKTYRDDFDILSQNQEILYNKLSTLEDKYTDLIDKLAVLDEIHNKITANTDTLADVQIYARAGFDEKHKEGGVVDKEMQALATTYAGKKDTK